MEIIAKNFEDIIKKLGNPINKKLFIYRGQSNSEWDLIPKVGRKPYSEYFTNSELEKELLESWKRYSVQYIDKMPIDEWDWLTLAQHYNLATRLLDWSKNPLIGLFFTIYKNNNTDAALFILLQPFSQNRSDSDPYSVKKLRCLYPKGISTRVINQRGVFTITPDPQIPLNDLVKPNELTKIIIPKKIISDIKTNLDFFGINELSIYPDLSGLSEYLNCKINEMIK